MLLFSCGKKPQQSKRNHQHSWWQEDNRDAKFSIPCRWLASVLRWCRHEGSLCDQDCLWTAST